MLILTKLLVPYEFLCNSFMLSHWRLVLLIDSLICLFFVCKIWKMVLQNIKTRSIISSIYIHLKWLNKSVSMLLILLALYLNTVFVCVFFPFQYSERKSLARDVRVYFTFSWFKIILSGSVIFLIFIREVIVSNIEYHNYVILLVFLMIFVFFVGRIDKEYFFEVLLNLCSLNLYV